MELAATYQPLAAMTTVLCGIPHERKREGEVVVWASESGPQSLKHYLQRDGAQEVCRGACVHPLKLCDRIVHTGLGGGHEAPHNADQESRSDDTQTDDRGVGVRLEDFDYVLGPRGQHLPH